MKFEKRWKDSRLEAHDDGTYYFNYGGSLGYSTFPDKDTLKKVVLAWVEDRIEDLIKELDAMRKLKNFINKL